LSIVSLLLKLLVLCRCFVSIGALSAGFNVYKSKVSALWNNLRVNKALRPLAGGLLAWLTAMSVNEAPDSSSNMALVPKVLLGQYTSLLTYIFTTMAAAGTAISSGAIGGPIAAFIIAGSALGAQLHTWFLALVCAASGVAAASNAVVGSNLAYGVAGAAGLIAAAMDAPLMAAALILEMSGRFDLALPTILATVSATAVQRLLN
jgi:H+/Cl- antiporter ClcA